MTADEAAYTDGVGALSRDELGAYLRRLYDQGLSIRRLAFLTGRSPGYVRALLVEHGATIRQRSRPRPRMTATQRERLDDLMARGILIPAQQPGRRTLPIPMRIPGLRLGDYLDRR